MRMHDLSRDHRDKSETPSRARPGHLQLPARPPACRVITATCAWLSELSTTLPTWLACAPAGCAPTAACPPSPDLRDRRREARKRGRFLAAHARCQRVRCECSKHKCAKRKRMLEAQMREA